MRFIAVFAIWLGCVSMALAIAASIVALFIVVGEPRLSTEAGAYLPWMGLLIGGFAGYWAGGRTYRRGKRWLSAKWPVGGTPAANPGESGAAGPAGDAGVAADDAIRFPVTNRQRRLIVLSVAIALLLGPVVIMGNCSGFNEGSMKVAACAVDFPLARALADIVWGIVLISAFMIGLPILAYVAACIVLLKRLNVMLSKSSAPQNHSGVD